MTAVVILAGIVAVFAIVGVTLLASRRDRDWTPPEWWANKIDGPGLRQSIRTIDDRAPAELVEVRDPRVLRTGRRLRRSR